jgi:hypothetical protein
MSVWIKHRRRPDGSQGSSGVNFPRISLKSIPVFKPRPDGGALSSGR